MPDTEYLTVAEVAELLDVTRQTVHDWVVAGKLPVIQPFPGSKRRFRKEDIEPLLVPKLMTG